MARVRIIISAAAFEDIFANRQRAMVLAANPAHMPGNLMEIGDGKRTCERLVTHVEAADVEGPLPLGAELVSFRPLTKAEKGGPA